MAGKGGKTEGAGRKPIADEQKTNYIFIEAIKQVKNVTTDDEARIELTKQLLSFERGLIFVSEHIFGKPTNHVDHSTMGEKLHNIINLGVGVNPEENK
jgi:hypothetical protein